MKKIVLISIILVGFLSFIHLVSAFVIISPVPIIGTTGILPTGTINEAYSQTLQVSGGTAPYTWAVIAGSLPLGLTLNSSTGTISGTPTSTGLFNFTTQVTDASLETASQAFALTIAPQSQTGFVYTRTPSGSPIINPVTVRIQGVFGVDFCTDPRTENYTVRANNQQNQQAILISRIYHTQGEIVDDTVVGTLPLDTYTKVKLYCQGGSFGSFALETSDFDVEDAPAITTLSLPDGLVGELYSEILQAVGGELPYTWSAVSGNLPSGLILDSSTGEISGIPTVVEIANFTVQVESANLLSSTREFSLTIHGNTPVGQNVVVGPLNGITLTFTEVTQEGHTTVSSSSSGTAPPSGFKLGSPPTYYDISTTAEFTSTEVCIEYNEIQFRQEKNLKLFHFENGAWVNVTTLLDTTNNIVCGEVSAFSEFALLENLTIDHIVDEVKSFNLDENIEQGLLDKLNAANSAIDRGKDKTARNILKAFINQVKAQRGKKITNEQADILLNDANTLIGDSFLMALLKFVMFGWLDKLLALIY